MDVFIKEIITTTLSANLFNFCVATWQESQSVCQLWVLIFFIFVFFFLLTHLPVIFHVHRVRPYTLNLIQRGANDSDSTARSGTGTSYPFWSPTGNQ